MGILWLIARAVLKRVAKLLGKCFITSSNKIKIISIDVFVASITNKFFKLRLNKMNIYT